MINLDPVTLANLFLTLILVIMCIIGYWKIRSTTPLYIGVAFFLFGVSHLVTLLGLNSILNPEMLIIRVFGYIIVCIGVYLVINEIVLRIKTEDDLKIEQAMLERHVSERTFELRQANEELHISEERFRHLSEVFPETIFEADLNGTITYANDHGLRQFGYNTEDIKSGLNIFNLASSKYHNQILTQIQEKNQDLNHGYLEFQAIRKDGSNFWAMGLMVPIIKNEVPVGIEGFVLDISPRKQLELALQENEEKFRGIFDSINDGIHIHDVSPEGVPGKFIEVNEAACRMLQYTRKEFLEFEPLQIVTSYHSRPLPEIFEELSQMGHSIFETEHRRKDGTIYPVEVNAHIVNLLGKQVTVAVIRDITRRKQTELELIHLSDRLSLATRAGGVGIWDFDAVHNTVTWDDQMFTLYGITREQFSEPSRVWQECLHPDDKLRVDAEITMALRKEKDFDIEFRVFWPDKSIHYIRELAIIQRNSEDIPIRMIGTNWDITKQKLAEEQIRQVNQRMTLAAKVAKFGVWDLVTDHLDWDDSMLQLYGINREDFEGVLESWQNRIYPEDQSRVHDEVERAFREKKLLETEFRILRSDGEIRYCKTDAIVVKENDHPTCMTGICYDITDRKQYEWEITQYAEQLGTQNLSLEELSDELAQMNQDLDAKVRERTEEISRLLSIKNDLITQIGHDLKTPLTTFLALLPSINEKVHDPDLQELLEVVIRNARRMNQIINSILTLSRIDIKNPEELAGKSPVVKIIDQVILAEQLRISLSNLQIRNLADPSFVIKMNESHCDMLFSNIIGNAIKYSKENGLITISSKVTEDSVCIIVQDDGQGIEPEHLPRIFDEFFKVDSSRHDRDSHGLGLALVQRVVKSYGGTVTAESEGINRGTTIQVCLPVQMILSDIE